MTTDPRKNLFDNSADEDLPDNSANHLDMSYASEVGEPGENQIMSEGSYAADTNAHAIGQSGGFGEEIFSNDHEDEGLEE